MVGIHQYADTYSRKMAKSIKIQKLRKSKEKKSRFLKKALLGNVVRKLHAKFHEGSWIRKLSNIICTIFFAGKKRMKKE